MKKKLNPNRTLNIKVLFFLVAMFVLNVLSFSVSFWFFTLVLGLFFFSANWIYSIACPECGIAIFADRISLGWLGINWPGFRPKQYIYVPIATRIPTNCRECGAEFQEVGITGL